MAMPAEKQPQSSSLSSSTVLDAVNISDSEVSDLQDCQDSDSNASRPLIIYGTSHAEVNK